MYEDGEDCERPIYVTKLSELKLVGEATKRRKTEYEGRRSAVEAFGHSLQMATKAVDAYKQGDEKYEHLLSDDIEKVSQLIADKKSWVDKCCATLERTDKTTDPSILISEFYNEKDSFETIARPILTKPKPKVEPPPLPKEPEKENLDNNAGNNGDIKSEEGKTMDVEEKNLPNSVNQTVNGEHVMELD